MRRNRTKEFKCAIMQLQFFFQDLFLHLFEGPNDRGGKRREYGICYFTLQMLTTAWAEPGLSQELAIPHSCFRLIIKTLILRPSSVAFLSTLAGSTIGSRVA